ncbi:hypothetical protein AMS58_13205 [Pseudoalteromonas porphyrae]|uniref:ABC transporter substrate-binding protein n=1 Tax=Pseudoalteromonas porphyrae TaxID=187330 RepID=UPI0006CE0F47|nr:ABC transporter substrate-binding protein [Pseudoalteromonas porphyrae]KPH94255.1 hypothetical protein AMS58_13205 [Pseudoalteromonas porphyrae]
MRLVFWLFFVFNCSAFAQDHIEKLGVFNIYHDSDYSTHNPSAVAMQMGFMTALNEVGNTVNGYQINFLEKDNRGNSNRSFLTMKRFLNDPKGLAILGGLHSPPYIKHRDFINENGLLLLVPWAAGGPITRYPNIKNWVFRLSLDDTKAGMKMVEYATQTLKCNSVDLLLENTPWGISNHKTMTNALGSAIPNNVYWFNWNVKLSQASILLKEIEQSKSDCVMFVGNAVEGKYFVKAMANLPKEKQKPIVSHWGITGGDFFNSVSGELNNGLPLYFLQSCFDLNRPDLDLHTQQVLDIAAKLFPDEFKQKKHLLAPAGFVHGYDIGKILIAAMNDVDLVAQVDIVRDRVRKKLEELDKPITGLIKVYQRPYSIWSEDNPDAHEALGAEDICMAQFNNTGQIHIITPQREI